jgi:hypothetical protein
MMPNPCIGHSRIVAQVFCLCQRGSHPGLKGVPPIGGAASPVAAAIFLWKIHPLWNETKKAEFLPPSQLID